MVAAFPEGPDGDWRRAADVVPDGTGWFGVRTGGLGGAVSVRAAGPEFLSTLYTAPRAPAPARALTISGGRVAYVDDHTAAGWANSVQVLAEDGVARPGAGPVALDTTPARGRYGVTQAVAHGSRTVLIRGNGRAAWFGWPDDPRVEALRDAWMDATDEAELRRLDREIQSRAFETVPFIPLGQYLPPSAWRGNLRGILRGPVPVFWNVEKG